jgi:ADP-ribose pyrophosphatase YjhB (NUDIX family)
VVKKLQSNSIYQDQWVQLFVDKIEYNNQSTGTYAWVKRRNGVVVVVVLGGKKILLQKEYRYPLNQFTWELPGGGIESNLSLTQSAQSELEQETGSTEENTVFFAEVETAHLGRKKLDPGEQVSKQSFFSFAQALEMIDQGQVKDLNTANAIQMVVRHFQDRDKLKL